MANDRQRRLVGAYIRQQRKLADLSMRQVSSMVGISNPYLSQIERGLRAPSEAVAAGIATALGMSVDELYDEGPRTTDADDGTRTPAVLEAIAAAQELTPAQRASLVEVYRSFVSANASARHPAEDRTPAG